MADNSDAAVGSISHILKTAFKDVYQESERKQQAEREREAANAAKDAQRARKAERAAAAAEAAEADEVGGDPEGGGGSGDEENKEEADEATLHTVEPDPLLPNVPNLYDNLADDLVKRKKSIDDRLSDNIAAATKLKEYMVTEKIKAFQKEEEEEEFLKKQGIMVGQHIPPLPSKLDIEAEKLSSYGDFSSNLQVAKDMVEANRINALRRTGNLPISELAEQRKIERLSKSKGNNDDTRPHYMQNSQAMAIREERQKERYAVITNAVAIENKEKYAATGGVKPRYMAKYGRPKDQLTGAEVKMNKTILNRMNHKMNYLRDPHNENDNITKRMLVTNSNPLTQNNKELTRMAGTSGIEKKEEVEKVVVPHFCAEPQEIFINDFEVGRPIVVPISFTNVSSISRTVRVIPPGSKEFILAPLKYPVNSKGGMCAPGMSVTSVITFFPETLAEAEDMVLVETEAGSYSIPIVARRDSPKLSMPPQLNVGTCLVGDALRVQIYCQNVGGYGQFRVVREEDYDVENARIINRCIRMNPFTIYPCRFDLDKMQSVTFIVEFVPLELQSPSRPFQHKFYILSDSQSVFEYTLIGSSRQIDCYVSEINSSPFDQRNQQIRRELFFEAANIGVEQSQQIVVTNDTGLPVEYEWVWIDPSNNNVIIAGYQVSPTEEPHYEDDPVTVPTTAPTSVPTTAPPLTSATQNKMMKSDNIFSSQDQRRGKKSFSAQSGASHRPLSGTPAQAQRNAVVEKSFELTPARGIMGKDGDETFTITFVPSAVSLTSMQAVLLLKNVPEVSIPSDVQSSLLSNLLHNGHGHFVRLRSWIEQLGPIVNLVKWKEPLLEDDEERNIAAEPDVPESTRLVNLRALIDMVYNHGSGCVLPSDIFLFEYGVRLILAHVNLFRKKEMEEDVEDEPEEESKADNDSHGAISAEDDVLLGTYYWKPLQFSLKLMNALHDRNKAESQYDILGMHVQPGNFVSAEDHMLDKVWIEPEDATHLLGKYICEVLDLQVKHEAVDFLREKSLKVHSCLSIMAAGEGKPQVVRVQPPLLSIGGKLPIEQTWNGQINLVNTSTAMAEVEFSGKSQVSIVSEVDLSKIQIEFDPPRILLMPETSATVNVFATVYCLGEYDVSIPVRSSSTASSSQGPADSSGAQVDRVHLSFKSVGPHIRFSEPEVDLGLVGVSGETSCTYSFTNDGSSSVLFQCVPLSEEQMDAVIREKASQGQEKNSSALVESSSNVEGSIATASVAGEASQAESKTATLRVEPATGEIQPGETVTVTLHCKGGYDPQRVRGCIQTKLTSTMKEVDCMPDQYIGYRCEVQAPKTILYPMNIDLGVFYIGIPVYFDIFTENICNLPTSYCLERPGSAKGEASTPAYRLTFDKPAGPLGPKEKVTIRCEFVALRPGEIEDELIANIIRGVPDPLGFFINGNAMPPLADSGSSNNLDAPAVPHMPLPIAAPSDTRYPHDDPVPEPLGPRAIEFSDGSGGGEVPLYERCIKHFALRNLSAVPMKFTLLVNKFSVAGNVSAMTKAVTRGGTTKALLMPHEDGANKFHSVDGKKHAEASVQRKENRLFLQSGLGASYLVSTDNCTGYIDPWGVAMVTIRTFNDMPGNYDDSLSVTFRDILDLGWSKTIAVPLKMSVTGCPLVVDKSTYGMTKEKLMVYRSADDPTPQPKEAVARKARDMLSFGSAAFNAEPITRELYVQNNGSMPGRVTWKVRAIAKEKMNGPIKLNLELETEALKEVLRAKTVLNFWSDLTKDSPFNIEPTDAVIAPYGKQKFKVTLYRTTGVPEELAQLIGSVKFVNEQPAVQQDSQVLEGVEVLENTGIPGLDNSQSVASTLVPNPSPANQIYRLNMLLKGTLVNPTIVMDKNTLVATSSETIIPMTEGGIKFRTEANSIFGTRNQHGKRGGMAADESKDCSRIVTLKNPTDTTLVCTVSTQGQFALKLSSDDSGAVKAENAKADKIRMSKTGPSAIRTSVGGGSNGRIITLLPQASSSLALSFQPSRGMRDTITKTKQATAAVASNDEEGNLVISFNTGQRLFVPLLGSISTPFLVGSSPSLFFGTCKVGFSTDGTMLLTNPTHVLARWVVKHVPVPNDARAQRLRENAKNKIKVPGYEYPGPETDDPSVFFLTPTAGTVEGPTVSVVSAVAAPPKDLNRGDQEVVPQRLTEASWATQTLTLKDTMDKRHNSQGQFEADARFPLPVEVIFKPKDNKKYASRFRFTCEYGNFFDLMLYGNGTFEEFEHNPLQPKPK
eukprot:GSChrysophyteH1.ASY1.ANO1.537.1 assembled CDS